MPTGERNVYIRWNSSLVRRSSVRLNLGKFPVIWITPRRLDKSASVEVLPRASYVPMFRQGDLRRWSGFRCKDDYEPEDGSRRCHDKSCMYLCSRSRNARRRGISGIINNLAFLSKSDNVPVLSRD